MRCEATAEGNPLLLAERRTISFANRKVIIGSTPLFEDTSHVLRAYGASDQRVYEVPCPECGTFTEICGARLMAAGDPAAAAFRCPHCEALVPRAAQSRDGARRPMENHRPEVRGTPVSSSMRLIQLLPNTTWGGLATEFVAAKEDSSLFQTFVNTIFGRAWRESGEEIDETALISGPNRSVLRHSGRSSVDRRRLRSAGRSRRDLDRRLVP